MPVTWSNEKLVLLYCPGRGSNSRPSAHGSFKHGQGVPRPYSLVYMYTQGNSLVHENLSLLALLLGFTRNKLPAFKFEIVVNSTSYIQFCD